MEGCFQKSLQLFVTNGYCVFEDNIHVGLPDVLDGKSDYAHSPLPEFFVRARCPLVLVPSGVSRSRCMVERRGVFKQNIPDSSFSSTFYFLPLFFLFSFDN